ncbi:MAG: chromosomal replication initiator protein DnaA [Propionibacteriaceae bacterium]|jgi:chromosomal replication initiator protein|nr:chromosomal replication initiator protein DnaA [Propionibacteriaceae bacterium]
MTSPTDHDQSSSLASLWSDVLARLDPPSKSLVATCVPLSHQADCLAVAAPNDFTAGRLTSKLRTQIEQAASTSTGRTVRLDVSVDPSLRDQQNALPFADPAPATTAASFTTASMAGGGMPRRALASPGSAPFDASAYAHSRPPAPGSSDPALMASSFPANTVPLRPSTAETLDSYGFDTPTIIDAAAYVRDDRTPSVGAEKLNPRYTFDTFVIGSSNRFAHAAAEAVAETPGRTYNPLLIYGDSGLGKTHLLHAVGHYISRYHRNLRIKYVSTEELTNEFINALREKEMPQFRHGYREVDVLLIDDIQFLTGKIETQEEFFHTFNTLHNAQKQIVMTSDRPPKKLEGIEPRLLSRFESGLQADIQPADLETRIAILSKKSAAERLTVDPAVLEFIASRVQSNIRELEGALIRVTAFASLNHQQVDLQLANIVLKDLIPDGENKPITVTDIMDETAKHFDVTREDLISPNRTQAIALPRQIAMYLSRELTDLSLPKIGAEFKRDHTTVMHAYNKIKDLIAKDKAIFTKVSEITSQMKKHR